MKKTIFISIYFLVLSFNLANADIAPTNRTIANEKIQIILTTPSITIEPNFTGSDIYIAGVLENSDPLVRLQNRYDIIVVIEGPTKSMIMREKKRKMGVWVNADSFTFKNVPLFYSLATTREIRDITAPNSYKKLGLGLDYLDLKAATNEADKTQIFRDELITLKTNKNLYSENIGAVKFGSPSLFTAKFRLPSNVPVGRYIVHAYLFRDGEFIETVSSSLEILKAHLAYSIYRDAHVHSFWYGIIAVFVAVMTGFISRLFFRKD